LYETTIDEILEAQNGDQDKLNDIVERNARLIWSIVKRFQNTKYETEDLFQIGAIGLIKSIKKFDKQYNVKLSTFAVPYILGEIKRFLRDDGIIRISRSIKELGIKIKELEKVYMAKTGEQVCITKMSEILQLPEENISTAMEALQTIESINAKIGEDGKEIIETLVSEDDEQSRIVDKITILGMIKELSNRDREIIDLRYFKDKTQTQVAKILGISQVHVSRIEKKILNEFRNKLLA